MSDSILAVRLVLQARLNALRSGGVPAVAWEGEKYVPQIGTGYLRVHLLRAQTANPSIGDGHILETGIFQVSVVRPLNEGTAPAEGWAQTLRDGFPRGWSGTNTGVVVVIANTPSVAPAIMSSAWYELPVSIPYFSHLFN